MRTGIEMDKAELIKLIEENKTKHVTEFQTAFEAYKVERVTKLQEVAQKASEDALISLDEVNRMPRPESHEEDYDRALDQLKYEQRDKLTLSDDEFEQFVRDNWAWKAHFTASNARYT